MTAGSGTGLALLAMVVLAGTAGADMGLFPSFADDHTLGLWLFDESQYPYATLTDAGPYEHDLCLMERGLLVEGRYGMALRMNPGAGLNVCYAGWQGSVSIDELREEDGVPSGVLGPTIAPKQILAALQGGDWTLEFWLRLQRAPAREAVVLDLGDAGEPGFSLSLIGTIHLRVFNFYSGVEVRCPLQPALLGDREWHHLALTWSQAGRAMACFLDGRRQPAPQLTTVRTVPPPPSMVPEERDHTTFGFEPSSPREWRQAHRFRFYLGHDRDGYSDLDGELDELRLSSVVRYAEDFSLPESLARAQSVKREQVEGTRALPLLFTPQPPRGPVQLGGRRHLFIDAALLASRRGLELACQPPVDPQPLDVPGEGNSWRPSVFDLDGRIYLLIPDGYGSSQGITRLRISEDGLRFALPGQGVLPGQDADIVLEGRPLYGSAFVDANPVCLPEERIKLTAWSANRGIYCYVSPDGLHWRRNESSMLPLVSGGGAETFWDDQRGIYVTFIKRDSSFNTPEHGGSGRRAVMFESPDILQPCPFNALEQPYFEGWPMPAVTGEGPVIFAPSRQGQVYRTRALKYPWAPDTYLAFVWRFDSDPERIQVDLGVSRDGVNWRFFADREWYIPGEGELDGDQVVEALSVYGLIRRGDEIWQYAQYGTGGHGAGTRALVRLRQRLDGFVALQAGGRTGRAVTRPLVFAGNRLILNVDASQGQARVGLLDTDGEPIPGYGLKDCDSITVDSTQATVSWGRKTDVAHLAGRTVQVEFELRRAKLFAFQFVGG